MLVSTFVAGIVGIVISVVVARELGVHDFGIYAAILAVQNIVAMVSTFGIPRGLAKFIAEFRVTRTEWSFEIARFGIKIAVALILVSTAIYVGLSGVIGNELYGEKQIADYIPLSGLVAATTTLLAVSRSIAQGCQNIRIVASIGVISPVLTLGAIVFLMRYSSIGGVLFGYSFGQGIAALLTLAWISKSGFPFMSRNVLAGDSVPKKAFIEFTTLSFFAGAISVIVVSVGVASLAVTSGFEAAGNFTVAYVIFSAFALVPSAMIVPLLPRVSELSVVSFDRLRTTMEDVTRLVSSALFPIMFGVALYSESLVELLYGESYRAAGQTAYLMILAGYLYALSSISATLHVGTGEMRRYFKIHVVWAFILTAVALVSVHSLAAIGLASAFVSSYAVMLVLFTRTTGRVLSMRIWPQAKTTASAVVFFSVGYFLKYVCEFGDWATVGLLCVGILTITLPSWKAITESLRRLFGALV